MSRQRIWILNGALCVLLVWGGMNFRKDWNAFGESHQPGRLQFTADRVGAKAPVDAASVAATDVAWTDIASRTPFSFDRNDISLDLTEPVAPPVSAPKPFLFGTLLLGNERLALMGKSGSGGRSGSRVKVGETFEGWQVLDIQDSVVVVTANGTKESITVGRAAVVRSSEKTAESSPTPTANSVAAPSPTTPTSTAPRPGTPLRGLGNMGPRPIPPPGYHIVDNPFGYIIEKDAQ